MKFFIKTMSTLSSLIRVSIPNYLAGLPVPDTFTGWFKLGSMKVNRNSMHTISKLEVHF